MQLRACSTCSVDCGMCGWNIICFAVFIKQIGAFSSVQRDIGAFFHYAYDLLRNQNIWGLEHAFPLPGCWSFSGLMHPVGSKNQRDTVAQNGNFLMNRFDEFNRGCTLNTKNMNQYISMPDVQRKCLNMSHILMTFCFKHSLMISHMFPRCFLHVATVVSHIFPISKVFSRLFPLCSYHIPWFSKVVPWFFPMFPWIFPWFSHGFPQAVVWYAGATASQIERSIAKAAGFGEDQIECRDGEDVAPWSSKIYGRLI